MAVAKIVSLSEKKCSNLLQGLVISPWQPNIFQKEEEPADFFLEKQMKDSLDNLTISSKMSCSLCNCAFQSRLQQTDHYKLDWHRFNLKQSIMGKPSLSAEVFESLTGEISSISGSDDDDDDDTDTTSSKTCNESTQNPPNREKTVGNMRLPRVFFKNHHDQLVTIYICLLQAKKEGLLTQSELVSRATNLPSNLNWAILMTAGGHFAAAIFNGSEIVLHKTFHRYTVRAKRGTAQGARDGQQGGNAPRSAGASLRRYNEAQLQENVGNLLKSWQEQLDNCSCIFIRAPSYNRSVIFNGKKAILKTDDRRIRTIPFPTRRPTLKEVKRVWAVLSSVECFDDAEAAESKFFHPPVSRTREVDVEDSTAKNEHETETTSSVSEGTKLETKEEICEDVADGGQSDGSDESIEFVLEEVTSYTSHLQESEIFIPNQKRRKKKKKATPKVETALHDKQLRKIQTALFTSCKTGDADTFERKMTQLREKLTQDIKISTDKSVNQNSTDLIVSDVIEDNADGPSLIGDVNLSSKDIKSLPGVCDDVKGDPFPRSVGSASQESVPPTIKGKSTPLGERTVPPCDHQPADVESLNETKLTELDERMESFLNEKLDSSGNSLLHVAAIEGQITLLWKLLSFGANPAFKNVKGLPPFAVSKNKSARQEFRRFMGQFPERYDYKTSQIPAPLSAEEEAARVNKAADKKREQKKTKRIKQKEQKEQQQRNEEEEKEKQIFAALSDREKRAVAAEKRLADQLNRTNRCFICATSLDGKVPFHYSEFSFCSMTCLKTHKQQHQL